jgi:hypothetical protein
MKQVLIYLGEFAYDLGNVFSTSIAEGFRQNNYEVSFADLRDTNSHAALKNPDSYKKYDFVFAINGIRPFHENKDFRFYRDTGCVFFAFLIDPPLIHYERLMLNNDIVSSIDRSHTAFLKKYFPANAAEFHTIFHGGSCASPHPIVAQTRKYDIMFPGTFASPDECYQQIQNLPAALKDTFQDALDILMATDTVTIFDALEQVMNKCGVNIAENPAVFELFRTYFPVLNRFVRLEKRMQCLKTLDKAGMKVDIWGNNWPDKLFKNHIIHPAVSLNNINTLMNEAKTVLDLGFYEDGSHERVFTSMLNGALAITLDNAFHREHFSDGQDICLYNYTGFGQLPERLDALLRDDSSRAAIAAAGQVKAQESHTWQNRAEDILRCIDEFKNRQSNK